MRHACSVWLLSSLLSYLITELGSIVSSYPVDPYPVPLDCSSQQTPSTLVYHICYRCNMLSLKQLIMVPISDKSACWPATRLSASQIPTKGPMLAAWLLLALLTRPLPSTSPNHKLPFSQFLIPIQPCYFSHAPSWLPWTCRPPLYELFPTFPFPLMTWFSLLAMFSLLLPLPDLDSSRCLCTLISIIKIFFSAISWNSYILTLNIWCQNPTL